MSLFTGAMERQVRQIFAGLPHPVTLLAFVRSVFNPGTCESCGQMRELVRELASISDGRVLAETYDLDAEPPEAILYGIDKAPALVVLGGESGRRDFGIRFFGTPVGYEFATLIEDIRLASAGTADLAGPTLDALSRLTVPLQLNVFVTPTCPYCPRAVLLAHRLAVASDLVTAAAIDATEFPMMARRCQVSGVPRTVINDTVHVEGAVPEAVLMEEVEKLPGAAVTVRPACR